MAQTMTRKGGEEVRKVRFRAEHRYSREKSEKDRRANGTSDLLPEYIQTTSRRSIALRKMSVVRRSLTSRMDRLLPR